MLGGCVLLVYDDSHNVGNTLVRAGAVLGALEVELGFLEGSRDIDLKGDDPVGIEGLIGVADDFALTDLVDAEGGAVTESVLD